MPIAIFALAISAFAIGTTEFVIIGLVNSISDGLSISKMSAGSLLSLYALSVGVSAPIITALTGKIHRKLLLALLMIVFTVGNIICWMSPNFATLVVARVLTGFAHGVFFSIGATVASTLVPKEKRGMAVATMFAGLTLSFAIGVPLGSWIGDHWGWRSAFLIVAGLGAIGVLSILLMVPNGLPTSKPANVLKQIISVKHHRLLIVYCITIIGYGGNFMAYMYFKPLLEDITGFKSISITVLMLVYGAFVTIGNISYGKLTDKLGSVKTLYIVFGSMAVILFILGFTIHSKILVIPTIIIWGSLAFGSVSALQVYVVQLAKDHTPHSVEVASGLNIACFNTGIALGTLVGGYVFEYVGLQYIPFLAMVVVLFSVLLVFISSILDKKRKIYYDDSIPKNAIPE